MGKYKDVKVGEKYGRLTVLRQGENYIFPKSKSIQKRWICKCDCDDKKEVLIIDSALKNGKTKSCGCYHKRQKEVKHI